MVDRFHCVRDCLVPIGIVSSFLAVFNLIGFDDDVFVTIRFFKRNSVHKKLVVSKEKERKSKMFVLNCAVCDEKIDFHFNFVSTLIKKLGRECCIFQTLTTPTVETNVMLSKLKIKSKNNQMHKQKEAAKMTKQKRNRNENKLNRNSLSLSFSLLQKILHCYQLQLLRNYCL